MDSDIKRWSKLLDIDILERRIIECQEQIDDLYRKRNEYRIRLNIARKYIKIL